MFKKLVPLFISLGLLFNVAYAEENFTISGQVTFQYDADIYICLYTAKTYKFMHERIPSPPYLQIIKLDPEVRKAGRTSFKFVGVPKGTYGIIAFQETIKNEKFDVKPWFGVSDEPFGCYKALPPEVSVPNWG
jgi:hypothetical protein